MPTVIPSPRIQKKSRIEIIPLIDIMFFLLATFIIVSASMVKNSGIPVQLPTASTSEKREKEDHIAITVTNDGTYFFNKTKVTVLELEERLRQVGSIESNTIVLINGDSKADFENIVKVLDTARKTGVHKVSIQTNVKPIAP